MTKNALFIAATGQNVGKTTTCLGILSGLRKRFQNVGFIKPVGQQHVEVDGGLKVDKDVVLFKEVFDLNTPYEEMSPVIIPPGFTRKFLDGKVNSEALANKILRSFGRIHSQNDFTIVEGTGHVGVGTIVGLNNAKGASELNIEVVIIATGGLGSSIDELALNIELCRSMGVTVRGVILNKVLENKQKMICEYFPKALKRWNIPLIGCIPYNVFLDTPTMGDFEFLFKTKLLSGEVHRMRHFQDKRLVACSLSAYVSEMKRNQLIITPATRHDIITAIIDRHQEEKNKTGRDFGGGIILTGRHPPNWDVMNRISHTDVPILYAPIYSYDAMKMITSYTAKIGKEDKTKVQEAIRHVESHLDFDLLVQPASLATAGVENE